MGSQIDVNTESLRKALWQRLLQEEKDTDVSFEIYGEALVGLARRKDRSIINILLTELKSDCVDSLAIEAAEEIGDRTLHPALTELKEWWDGDSDLLDRAIQNCSQVSK